MNTPVPGMFSIEWWLSVVLVGVAINVVSVVVIRIVAAIGARISKSYATRRDLRRSEADELHRRLVASGKARRELRAELTQRSLVGLENLMIALFWMFLGIYANGSTNAVFGIAGGLAWIVGCVTWMIALNIVAKTRFRTWDLNRAEREAKKAAQPGATDNPDDAQRLREDN